MNVSASTKATRLSIDNGGVIAAMEDLFAMLAGVITATGGSFAIAGRDIYESTLASRAAALTEMYDAGEVVIGYADARNGDIVNIVVEHLLLNDGDTEQEPRPIWRALVFVEEPMGHELRGVLAGQHWSEVAQQLFDAVNDGLRRPLPDQRTALAGAAGH